MIDTVLCPSFFRRLCVNVSLHSCDSATDTTRLQFEIPRQGEGTVALASLDFMLVVPLPVAITV